jgi:hypothetical protein
MDATREALLQLVIHRYRAGLSTARRDRRRRDATALARRRYCAALRKRPRSDCITTSLQGKRFTDLMVSLARLRANRVNLPTEDIRAPAKQS